MLVHQRASCRSPSPKEGIFDLASTRMSYVSSNGLNTSRMGRGTMQPRTSGTRSLSSGLTVRLANPWRSQCGADRAATTALAQTRVRMAR